MWPLEELSPLEAESVVPGGITAGIGATWGQYWVLAEQSLSFLFSRVLRVWNLWQEVQVLQLFPDPCTRTPR